MSISKLVQSDLVTGSPAPYDARPMAGTLTPEAVPRLP
jgi:hypothetical protein